MGGVRSGLSRIATLRLAVLIVAALLAIILGWRAAMPPTVVPATAVPTLFSAGRALADIQSIAIRPHPTGTSDSVRVSTYLALRMAALGMHPEIRNYLMDQKSAARLQTWSGGIDTASEVADVIGVLPGRDRAAPALVLMAHYDTVWGSPGAGDDSVGVASALEIVRAIEAKGTPARDVILLLTDGEELGLCGARAFWSDDALARHAGVVINLETRGAGGRATMFETGDGNGPMMALFADAVPHPVANSLAAFAYRIMPNSTDFTPVRKLGLPGFNFAIMGRAAYYHSPLATMDRLDPRSLQDIGDQGLAIATALAFAPALPAKGPDATFFDLGSWGFIHYPGGAGWLVILAGVAALAAASAGLRRAWRLTTGELLSGLLAALWLVCHALLAITLFNLISGAARDPNYYDRLAALSRLEVQAAAASAAAVIAYLALRMTAVRWFGALPAIILAALGLVFGGPPMLLFVAGGLGAIFGIVTPRAGLTAWGGWIGGIALLLIFAALVQIWAPTVAWLFAWPALVLGIAAAMAAWSDPALDRGIGHVAAGVAALLVVTPLVPLAHLAFLGIGAPYPQAMLPVALIAGVAFWPIAHTAHWRPMLIAVSCLAVIGAATAIRVRTTPLAASVPAYSVDK